MSLERWIGESHPTRDWQLLVGLFVVLICALAGIAALAYRSAVTRMETPLAQRAAVTNTSAGQHLKSLIDNRTTEEGKYRQGAYTYVDPSL